MLMIVLSWAVIVTGVTAAVWHVVLHRTGGGLDSAPRWARRLVEVTGAMLLCTAVLSITGWFASTTMQNALLGLGLALTTADLLMVFLAFRSVPMDALRADGAERHAIAMTAQ